MPFLDNYASHKHLKVKAKLVQYPRWFFYFASKSGSWLNAEGFSPNSLVSASDAAPSDPSSSTAATKRSTTMTPNRPELVWAF